MDRAFAQSLSVSISQQTQSPFCGLFTGSSGGGCINQNGRLVGEDGRTFFVKWNRAETISMFEAEYDGLRALRVSDGPLIPRALFQGVWQDRAFLVMEWLALDGRGNAEEMGRALAMLHQQTKGRSFGFETDNFIGLTPQRNTPESDWVTFFREHRLDVQIQLAEQRGGRFPHYAEFCDLLPRLIGHHSVTPSLVHGDLWSGNAAFCDGQPVLFDPAAYYGDREVDLAMTELFGGFPPSFYRAYDEVWPREAGYETRLEVYNLYHILNHFNLFGGGYGDQANRIMRSLCRA